MTPRSEAHQPSRSPPALRTITNMHQTPIRPKMPDRSCVHVLIVLLHTHLSGFRRTFPPPSSNKRKASSASINPLSYSTSYDSPDPGTRSRKKRSIAIKVIYENMNEIRDSVLASTFSSSPAAMHGMADLLQELDQSPGSLFCLDELSTILTCAGC